MTTQTIEVTSNEQPDYSRFIELIGASIVLERDCEYCVLASGETASGRTCYECKGTGRKQVSILVSEFVHYLRILPL